MPCFDLCGLDNFKICPMSENRDKRKLPLNRYREFFSQPKSIKIYVPDNDSNKNDKTDDDDFVGRTTLMNKLYNWLTDDKYGKGSFLVTGYRGMGKTSMVNRVLNRITREMKPGWEFVCFLSLVFLIASFFIYFSYEKTISIITLAISLALLAAVSINKYWFRIRKIARRIKFPWSSFLSMEAVDKMVNDPDGNDKDFKNIKISINLGHEVIKERDILCLIACSINEKYKTFVNSMQHRFAPIYIITAILCLLTCFSYDGIYSAFKSHLFFEYQQTTIGCGYDDFNQTIGESSIYQSGINAVDVNIGSTDNWFSRLMANIWKIIKELRLHKNLKYFTKTTLQLAFFALFRFLFKKIELLIPLFSTHLKVKKRLNDLTDRLNSSVDENSGSASNFDKGFINISLFGNRKHKVSQIADIREIETELISIVNLINDDKWLYKVKFYIVFDELDKIDPDITDDKVESITPEYTDSVKGFPAGIETRDRRKNVLKLLANIKLFISTANAKFVFISGRELYDAYLADLSDRDFAISSIFSGVINVDSFLSPEGGQTDVRSMAELYVANRLIPRQYLLDKEHYYAEKKRVLKKEVPSLRWYYEYLMDVEKEKTGKKTVDIERQKDIEFVMIFLRGFSAYLSHISNGSPKKIYLYFDKYVKNDVDTYNINNWDDEIVVGKSNNDDKQSVLYFNATQQNCINFIHYLSGPIMSTITNDLSSFGDRYLVSLSFVIDHIYKHHSRSFSWRDMEQIPELLKTSKAPELRKSMSSIMEFLLQIHISPIVIGFNEYKFHKSIAEEIDYMSKISDEASALFNFTLDESLAVIHHNTMLLNHYTELSKSSRNSDENYNCIIARIHTILGDLHFSDEDYYNATLEYRLALKLNGDKEGSLLTMVRINLKLGLTYEYRKMYPNSYYIYCQLISNLIRLNDINEEDFGLDKVEENVYDWRYHKDLLIHYNTESTPFNDNYKDEIYKYNIDNSKLPKYSTKIDYSQDIDDIVSGFSKDLTPKKASLISKLTLFEEVRYFYQAILAKLFSVEKMVMNGITQTNIDVAESEFKTLHRITNIEEKFIVSADFFCKLAEILYYKNSLTIRTKNQNSLASALYFDDFNVYAQLDSFCYSVIKNGNYNTISNAKTIKRDVKFFFENLDVVDKNNCFVDLDNVKSLYDNRESDIYYLYKFLSLNLNYYYNHFVEKNLIDDTYKMDTLNVVKGYLEHCICIYESNNYKKNRDIGCDFDALVSCSKHREELNKKNQRPPCYACKYYTRSMKILFDNLIIKEKEEKKQLSKSFDILRYTSKHKLRYSRVNQVVALAKTIEGMGNTMLSCVSFNMLEKDSSDKIIECNIGINPVLIQTLIKISEYHGEKDINEALQSLQELKVVSRLDRCIMYYWDAYRYYLIVSQYDDAINCLNKILTTLTYYTSILNYSRTDSEKGNIWNNETDTLKLIVGNSYSDDKSLVNIIFKLILRHSGFQYDNSGLIEIHEMKWLLSKDDFEMVDFSKLSRYPNIRASLLRLLEINIQGRRYLEFKGINYGYNDFIIKTYRLVSPSRRHITTAYEEILGYYVKTMYNGCIISDIFNGNPLLSDDKKSYNIEYPLKVYEKMNNYLSSDFQGNNYNMTKGIFKVDDISDKLELLEYVIHDSLVCLTKMVKVFTPHNHFTSYSKSFIAITFNLLWEWSRYYELLYWIYDYKYYYDKGDDETVDNIFDKYIRPIKFKLPDKEQTFENNLRSVMSKLCALIPSESRSEHKYGDLCAILYSRLKHDLDDVAINLIYSNYSAESALNYYNMAEETSTEGDAYKDMIDNLFFLNDDLNNDTCQFNLACERFLLNCDVIKKQKQKLHELYKDSNIYLSKSYIDGPGKVWDDTVQQNHNRFGRSEFINSKY